MSSQKVIIVSNPQETPENFGLTPTPVNLDTNGSLVFFENPFSNALCRIPTNPTALSWDKTETKKVIDGTEHIFEMDIKCLRRGNCQLSLFDGIDEIVLSDNSKKIFTKFLNACFEYYKLYQKDIENLRVKLTPKGIAPFLNITLSEKPETRKSQLKEAKKALRKFESEISQIRIIGSYSYYKNGKKETIQFDGGVFNKDSYTRQLDENKRVISEGYRVNPDFYYSLVNCYYVMQIPFTAFAVTGKNAFSIIFDLYSHARENKGNQKLKTRTLLEHLGFDSRINKPGFSRDVKGRIVEILGNALGDALKSFSFVSSTNGEPLDVETCSNSEWVDSTLIWEQILPSETEVLLEKKQDLLIKTEKRARASKRKSPTK